MQMDQSTQQNAALVEEASAAAQTLSAQATDLTELIEHYRRSESTPSKRSNDPGARSALEPPINGRRAYG